MRVLLLAATALIAMNVSAMAMDHDGSQTCDSVREQLADPARSAHQMDVITTVYTILANQKGEDGLCTAGVAETATATNSTKIVREIINHCTGDKSLKQTMFFVAMLKMSQGRYCARPTD